MTDFTPIKRFLKLISRNNAKSSIDMEDMRKLCKKHKVDHDNLIEYIASEKKYSIDNSSNPPKIIGLKLKPETEENQHEIDDMTVSVYDYNEVLIKYDLIQDQLKQKEELIEQYKNEVQHTDKDFEETIAEHTQELEERIMEMDEDYRLLEEETCELEDKMKEMKNQIAKATMEWKKVNMELKASKKREASLQNKIDKMLLTKKSPRRSKSPRKNT